MSGTGQSEAVDAFIEALEAEEGIKVDSTMKTGPGLSLMYTADKPKIGVIARVYAEHRDVTGFLSVTLLTGTGPNAQRVANFHIEREWAEAFVADELDSEEYAQRVAATYSSPAHYQGEL